MTLMAAMASGWMIHQSHLAVRSSHWMCCLVWGYENTEKGEDVVRFKSVCGNTLKILDTLFWWTVECRGGSYNQKRVADWSWTSPFCKWPGWYGLSRNRLWLGLGKVLQQHFCTGPITCWKWHWNFQTTLKMSCFLIDWQRNAAGEQPTVNIWTRQIHDIHNRILPVVWSMFQNWPRTASRIRYIVRVI